MIITDLFTVQYNRYYIFSSVIFIKRYVITCHLSYIQEKKENVQKSKEKKDTTTNNFDLKPHLAGHSWQESSITVISFSRSLFSTKENMYSMISLVHLFQG